MGRSRQDAARDVSHRGDRVRSAGRRPTITRATSSARSSIRSTSSTISRGRTRSSRTTAAAMPEISADGRVWKIRIRPGIYFTDDPAFKGKKRELVADDYVYAMKRLLDPKVRAPMLWFLGRQDRRQRRGDRQGEGGGPPRLRRSDRRARSRSIATRCRSHSRSRTTSAGVPDSDADGRGCARSDRSLRRLVRMGDGESRSAPGRSS
jgi:hypothetical protein